MWGPIGRAALQALTLGLVVALCSCAGVAPLRSPVITLLPSPDQIQLAPAGDSAIVTRRKAPGGGADVLCVSPSPDWATALATTRSLTGSGAMTGGPTASVGVSANDTQTIAQLAGRTAGVVALRDGLYQACQAYANGQIGRTAYALILSQYGNLLVQLAGVGAPSGGAGGSSAASSAGLLQQEHVQALLVACLNTYDQTLPSAHEDPILQQDTCRAIVKIVSSHFGDVVTPDKAGGGGPAQAGSSQPGSAQAGAASAGPKAPSPAGCAPGGVPRGAKAAEYRGVLRSEGFYVDPPRGRSAVTATAVALALYQTAKGLCPSGVPDAQTLKMMKLTP